MIKTYRVWYEGETFPYIHRYNTTDFKDETFNFHIYTDRGEQVVRDVLVKDIEDLHILIEQFELLYSTDLVLHEHEFDAQTRLNSLGIIDTRYTVELLTQEKLSSAGVLLI